MSIPAIIVLSIFFVFMFSEFGQRVQARNAGLWILMAAFIFIAALIPHLLRPIADILGITLVSNFVLATLVLFLFLQVFDLSAELTTNNRKLRQLVSRLAAESFSVTGENKSPSSTSGSVPRVLIVFPCFNEEASVSGVIERIRSVAATSSGFSLNYCFVDDGSTDGTLNLLQEKCPQNFVSHSANIGVSGVLLTGFQIMRRGGYSYMVQCDSDGQHPVEEIPKLLEFAEKSGCDLLVGSRFAPVDAALDSTSSINNKSNHGTTQMRIFGIGVIRFLLAFFRGAGHVTDPTSGFPVYSRKACQLLWARVPDEYPEPESIAVLSLFGAKIEEVRVQMQSRIAGVSSLQGLKSIRYMVKVSSALLGLRLRRWLLRVN